MTQQLINAASKLGSCRTAPLAFACDGCLAAGDEPPVGSHLVTPRRGYTHHGIYVGAGKVVHYAGLARGWQRGAVEEVSLAGFGHGQAVWVGSCRKPCFDRAEVARRARSRLGENRYRLLTNNCEHFCEWCLRGEGRSAQVEIWLVQPRRILIAALRVLLVWLRPPQRYISAT